MKKHNKAQQILVLLAAAFMFAGCSQEPEPTPTEKEKSYTVTFNKNTTDVGSTDADPRTKTVTPPETSIDALPKDPTRPGYVFDGWYTTQGAAPGTRWTVSTTVTASLTVYAKWTTLESDSFSVNFDKNGGDTEADPAQIVVYAPATKISENEYPPDTLPTPPEKANAIFVSWNTKADGSGAAFDADTTVSDHIIVYAQWDEIAAGNVAVFFWDREGTTQLKSIQIPQGTAVPAGDFPDKDTTIPYFQITSWKTENGAAFTSSTIVNATTNVYINVLTLVPGTPVVEGDTLVHNYPGLKRSTAGMHGTFNGTENVDGSVTFRGGAVAYTIPTPGAGDSWSVSNYDLMTLYLTVTDNSMGVISKRATDATDVLPYPSGNQWPTFNLGNNTWCVPIASLGNSGGIAFQFNNGADTNPSTFTLTKVVFEKGVKRTVTFDLNYNGAPANPASVTILTGLTVGMGIPAPTRAGYTFGGWWTENDGTGDRVQATTLINSDLDLYAHWISGTLQPVSIELDSASINSTLFNVAGDYATGLKYTLGGKEYWIVSDTRTYTMNDPTGDFAGEGQYASHVPLILAAQKSYGTLGGYTRLAFNLNGFADLTETVTQAPVDWKSYSTVTVTYDAYLVSGNGGIVLRSSQAAAGGTDIDSAHNQNETLTTGVGLTFTRPTAAFMHSDTARDGGLGIVKNGTGGAILLRITKVTLTPP